jgi:hypothetical protein
MEGSGLGICLERRMEIMINSVQVSWYPACDLSMVPLKASFVHLDLHGKNRSIFIAYKPDYIKFQESQKLIAITYSLVLSRFVVFFLQQPTVAGPALTILAPCAKCVWWGGGGPPAGPRAGRWRVW